MPPDPQDGMIRLERHPLSADHDPRHRAYALITLCNSAKLNCLSSAHITALTRNLAGLGKADDIAAVVLTGEGDKAFIGGADLNELQRADADAVRLFITRLHQACEAIRHCPVPVIAQINGFCLGAGLEVAARCDIRVAAHAAQFGMPEVHMGLPSVVEAALLPGLIGWGKTRDILLTGETFGAADAMRMGFIERLAPAQEGALHQEVRGVVDAIARGAPEAIRAQKALMNRWERVSVDEGIYAGIDAISDAYLTGEPTTRIAAFFEARARAKQSR
ncbi:MAG: enoyl-CoA hydratase-related protein [Pseudomonadota bacterium]